MCIFQSKYNNHILFTFKMVQLFRTLRKLLNMLYFSTFKSKISGVLKRLHYKYIKTI